MNLEPTTERNVPPKTLTYMGRQVIYDCDHCHTVTELTDLKSITAHIYDDNGEDPKVLELELVCSDCRADLTKLLKHWQG